MRDWQDLQVRWQDRHFGASQTPVGQTIPRQSGEILTRSTRLQKRPAFWGVTNSCWPNHSTTIGWDIDEIYKFADKTGILERHKQLLAKPFDDSQVRYWLDLQVHWQDRHFGVSQTSVGQTIPQQSGEILTISTSLLTRPSFWSVKNSCGQTIPLQSGEILTRSTSSLTRQAFWSVTNSCWPDHSTAFRWDIDEIYKFGDKSPAFCIAVLYVSDETGILKQCKQLQLLVNQLGDSQNWFGRINEFLFNVCFLFKALNSDSLKREKKSTSSRSSLLCRWTWRSCTTSWSRCWSTTRGRTTPTPTTLPRQWERSKDIRWDNTMGHEYYKEDHVFFLSFDLVPPPRPLCWNF